jgi:hypothetical protein
MTVAESILVAYRDGNEDAMIRASLADWDSDEFCTCSAHLYADDSIIADDGSGYRAYADLPAMLAATEWDVEDFDGWQPT